MKTTMDLSEIFPEPQAQAVIASILARTCGCRMVVPAYAMLQLAITAGLFADDAEEHAKTGPADLEGKDYAKAIFARYVATIAEVMVTAHLDQCAVAPLFLTEILTAQELADYAAQEAGENGTT